MQIAPTGFDALFDEGVIKDVTASVVVTLGSNRFNDGQKCYASSTMDDYRDNENMDDHFNEVAVLRCWSNIKGV